MIHIFKLSNSIAFICLLIYHTHMYQLNSYNDIEQKNWIKDNYYPLLGRTLGIHISIILLIIQSLLIRLNINIISLNFVLSISIILNIFTFMGNLEKNSKIPLKYTPRVKRMILSSVVIYILWHVFFRFINGNISFYASFMQIFLLKIQYLLMLANRINKPIENSINQKFINEAKQKINSMQNLTVIGITGSYGKTSVKHILAKLLGANYNVLITPGNYNTTLGVVITIREYLSPIHEIFICEMGAKSLGEIKEICDIVHPNHAIITSIGMQHLETFLSLENIIKTKFELADSIENDGFVLLNYDNQYIREHKIDKNVISYSIENESSNKAYDLKVDENGSSFKMKLDNREYTFYTKLLGKHNVLNISACISLSYKLGVDPDTLIQRVRMIEQIEHRQQIIKKDFGIIIDDAYNSNPSGAKSALDTLSMFNMTKIVITPGMIELGDKQYELNKSLGKQIAKVADYVILVGKKQTQAIQDGLKEDNFDEKYLFIQNDINSAISLAYSIKSNKQKAILIENDLPDNY